MIPLIQCTSRSSFILLQEFERQRDQGAPVRDIFKPPFLANTVSERNTISLFIILYDWSRRIRRPLLAPAGWGGVVGRVVNSRLITYDLTAEAAKVATIWSHHSYNPPGKDIEVVDALSTLSTESHEPIPEMNVQTHVVFPQLAIECCKRSKNRAIWKRNSVH